MSHDFPDGPDYNPEPIDDDPWDTPYAHPDPPEVRCAICEGYELPGYGHAIGCPQAPPASTSGDLSPSQP